MFSVNVGKGGIEMRYTAIQGHATFFFRTAPPVVLATLEAGPLPGTLPPYKNRRWAYTCEMVTKAGKDEKGGDRGQGDQILAQLAESAWAPWVQLAKRQ